MFSMLGFYVQAIVTGEVGNYMPDAVYVVLFSTLAYYQRDTFMQCMYVVTHNFGAAAS